MPPNDALPVCANPLADADRTSSTIRKSRFNIQFSSSIVRCRSRTLLNEIVSSSRLRIVTQHQFHRYAVTADFISLCGRTPEEFLNCAGEKTELRQLGQWGDFRNCFLEMDREAWLG